MPTPTKPRLVSADVSGLEVRLFALFAYGLTRLCEFNGVRPTTRPGEESV